MIRAVLVVSAVAVASCAGGRDGPPGDVVDAGQAPARVEFLAALTSVDDFEALKGSAGDVKFLAQVDGAPVTAPILEACEFQNTSLYSFHLPFLNSQPGGADITYDQYTDLVIRRAHRVWWGGQVIWLPQTPHPLTNEPGVLAWQLYTEDSNGNRLTLDDVRAGFARLSACTPGFAGTLAVSAYSSEQDATLRTGQAELAADQIAVLLP